MCKQKNGSKSFCGGNNTRFFFEGKELFKLHEFTPICLSSMEEKAWNELKQHLKEKSLTILCSSYGWNNFLERIIMTGNVPNFITTLDDFASNYPSKMYHLTDGGNLNTATVHK